MHGVKSLALPAETVRIGSPEIWRREHASRSRPITWDKGYGAPEASLVLDPTTMGLEDFSWLERRVILGFCMSMDGRYGSSVAAGPHAAKCWGITPEDLNLKTADRKNIKEALFGLPTEYGFFLEADDKPRVSRTIAMAPSASLCGGTYSTLKARNTFGLERDGLATCPVPKLILSLGFFKDLCPEPLELLFMLYGLNDLERHGGVDPSHLHVRTGDLVVSDSLLRGWRYGECQLPLALATLYDAGLVALVPCELRERRWYPAADDSVHYMGDSDDPECDTFVVRPVYQVEHFSGAWAA